MVSKFHVEERKWKPGHAEKLQASSLGCQDASMRPIFHEKLETQVCLRGFGSIFRMTFAFGNVLGVL